jgi:DEAD/DEAH box helicase domain-containing protein
MAVKSGLKTMVFAQSRLMVEVLTKYLKDVFDSDPRKPRASGLPRRLPARERRATEKALRAGNVDCVVATSALELGVDIGSLDVCVLNGYPGTVAATWQRFGRAGRRQRPSLGVLVATSQPLDQYIIRNPEFFAAASTRACPHRPRPAADPARPHPLRGVRAAVPPGRALRYGEPRGTARLLAEHGVLHREGGRWDWIADSYPAKSGEPALGRRGQLRGGRRHRRRPGHHRRGRLLQRRADAVRGRDLHGAVQPYQVERLDWTGRKAFVTRTEVDYYTDAIDYTRLKILDRSTAPAGRAHRRPRTARCTWCGCIPGYKKIRYYTHENIGYGNMNLPDQEMHTTAAWWQVAPEVLEQCFPNRQQALDGFLGAAYAMHHVAALIAMSEPQDIGRAVGDGDARWFATVGADGRGQMRSLDGSEQDPERETRFRPAVFLYDNYPGGVGLAAPLPACIGPILASDEERGFSPKASALTVLAQFQTDGPEEPA